MSEPKWLGLTDPEWLALWDRAGWRVEVARTLRQIARCEDASAETRLLALQVLSDGTQRDILYPDPQLPALFCQVMLAISRGSARKVRWWRRREVARLQVALLDRLTGARYMIQTGAQFMPGARESVKVLDLSHLGAGGLPS